MEAIEQLKQDVREGRIDADRLVDVIATQQRELQAAQQRIADLENQLAGSATAKVDEVVAEASQKVDQVVNEASQKADEVVGEVSQKVDQAQQQAASAIDTATTKGQAAVDEAQAKVSDLTS